MKYSGRKDSPASFHEKSSRGSAICNRARKYLKRRSEGGK